MVDGSRMQVVASEGREGLASDSDTVNETLSALMDDEAQEFELRRLLKSLDSEPQVLERWFRYQAAREALTGAPVSADSSFAASVRAALDEEPAHKASSASGGWLQAVGGFAVAASVAFVVVIGGQQLAETSASGVEQVARVAPIPVGVVNTTGAIPVQASFGTTALPVLQPADRTAYRELARQRLLRYSQEHAEHASLNTPHGMLPFARVPVIRE